MSFTRSIDSIHPDEPVSSAVEEHNGVLITQKPRPERVAGRHCIHICKAVLAHIGLALILVAYVIGGGYMFRALELSNEYSDCTQRQHNYRKILNFSTARVMALTESQMDGGTDDGQVSDAMVEFARQVFSLDFHPDANCSAIIHTNFGARWNVGNAMYFCVTIITTIGK
ncbi:unnamed protein product [Dicrocoelium dendriticum]|nr:unnamed protein product [Dicrocoelium dendriticum]